MKQAKDNRLQWGTKLLLLASVAAAGPAFAQQAGKSSEQLEEVVVTAEKRTENVQQVPIAITAFSAEALADKQVVDIHTISNLTPNVTLDAGTPFGASTSVLSASIRGIGQDDFAFNLDPGVGVYVDGVYYARTVGANQNLLDVDRVEILKGPQGTLFGRNTIGGAISVVTHEPGTEFKGQGQVTFGSLNRRDIAATVDVPITDKLLSSITISSLQRDGYQKRIPYPGNTGNEIGLSQFETAGDYSVSNTEGGQNQQVVRAKLVWLASDSVKVTLSTDFTHEDQSAMPNTILATEQNNPASLAGLYNLCVTSPNAAAATAIFNLLGIGAPGAGANVCGPIGPSIAHVPGGGFVTTGPALYGSNRLPYSMAVASTGNIDTTYADGVNFSLMDTWGASVTVDWTINDQLEFKSISGYRGISWGAGMDFDGSPITLVEPSFKERQHQESEEVQLIGKAFGDRLNYVAGLYGFNEGGDIHDFVPLTTLQIDGPNYLNTDSYAGFVHANYKLTDQIGLTAGARYSLDHKQFVGGQSDLNAFAYKIAGCYPVTAACQALLGFPVPGQPTRYFPAGMNTEDFYEFTPTAGAEYHFTDDVMTYYSYSKGFKSGGWTTRLSNPIPSASLAAYGPEKANTHEVGIKTELFDHKLRLNLAGFYTDYSQIQMQVQIGVSPTTKNAGDADILGTELESNWLIGNGMSLNTAVGYIDAYYTKTDPGTAGISGSAAALPLGTPLMKTPKWKIGMGPEYDQDLPNQGVLRFLGQWTHTSTMGNDIFDTALIRRPTNDVFDMSVAYVSPTDRYQVILGGTNISNTRYLTTGQNQTAGGFIAGTYNAPAEWYLQLKAKFKRHDKLLAPGLSRPQESPKIQNIDSCG